MKKAYQLTNTMIMLATLAITSCAVNPSPLPFLSTNSSSTHQPSPTSAFTPQPSATEQPLCLSIELQAKNDFPVDGKIVWGSVYFPPYLEDINSGEIHELAGDDYVHQISNNLIISPDRTLIAFSERSEALLPYWNLHIVNSVTLETKVIKVDQSWSNFVWLDDRNLLVEYFEHPGDISSVLIYDVTTGQETHRDLSFDHLLAGEYPSNWLVSNFHGFLVNPQFTKAAFAEIGDDHPIKIVDLQSSKILAKVPTSEYGEGFTWSPDGNDFTYVSNTGAASNRQLDEIFTIHDGQNLQLTRFSDRFDNYVQISEPSWFPDGYLLSFLLSTTSSHNFRDAHLVILDTRTGYLNEYCNPIPFTSVSGSIRSPDGKYLLWYLADIENQTGHVFVLDTEKRIATEVSNTSLFSLLVGWVK